MATAFDPIRNSAWLLIIKIPLIDCLRGSLGTISGKGSISRSSFRRVTRAVAIVGGVGLSIAVGDDNNVAEDAIY